MIFESYYYSWYIIKIHRAEDKTSIIKQNRMHVGGNILTHKSNIFKIRCAIDLSIHALTIYVLNLTTALDTFWDIQGIRQDKHY